MSEQAGSTPASAVREVGRVEDFEVGAFQMIELSGRQVGVVRTADGSFHAILDYCPHRGAQVCRGTVGGTMLPSQPGSLEYGMKGQIIRCPWHGFEFDLASGRRLFAHSRMRLKTFPVTVRDGVVTVHER